MTTIIIILAVVAAIFLFIALGIKWYNQPKVERERTDQQEQKDEFRRDRWSVLFPRRWQLFKGDKPDFKLWPFAKKDKNVLQFPLWRKSKDKKSKE